MSDDNKGGNSDLDIFEGLGKKSSPKTSAVPPPPPGSGSHVAVAKQPNEGLKKTLMGVAPSPMPQSDAAIPAPPRSVPPPLPGSASQPPSGQHASAPPAASPSGSMRAVQPASQGGPVSKPPPPPGRGSLPNLPSSPSQSNMPAASASPSTSPSATLKTTSQMPAPASTRPAPVASSQVPPAPSTEPQLGKSKANGGKLDMDWDDDDEATHVFDKDSKDNQPAAAPAGPESREPERASMDMIMSQPRPSSIPQQGPAAGTPPPPPAHTATLSGAFGALGQPRESANGSGPPPSLRSGPPPSQSLRSAPPPPPPGSMSNPSAPPASLRQPNPSTSTAPIPPPPPPGQTTTAPMHMPMRQPSHPPSHPPHQISQPPMAPPASMPPQQVSQPSTHPQMPQMPPVSRAMEATAMVPRPQQSKAGLWVALLVGVMAAVGAAVFFLMPRTGTLTVNVADAKGGSVKGLEVTVDGKKCESVPCVMPNIASGAHVVAVTAPGYDSLAPKAVTVESGKTASADFTLQGGAGATAGTAGGTGIKVAGNQSGVRLSVDGKEYGPLPQEIHDLAPGEHKVKISGSERLAPVEKTITVGKDEMVDLGNIQLKVLKGKVTINLGTPGAKVFLVSGTNRKEVPQFPIAIDFDPNEKWQLEAKLANHDDFTQVINFDDGQAEKTITVTLAPKGSTPAAPPTTAAAPAFHPPTPPVAAPPPVAAAPKEPKAPAEPPVAAAPKEPKAPKEPPPAAGGEAFLNINSLPASTVVLDGKPLGATPRLHVPVSPGSHTVLFVNAEQSLKKSITVTVGAGETKAAFAKLRD